GVQELHEGPQVELLEHQTEAVAAVLARFAGPVEHVVKVAQDVRGLVDQVQVELGVKAAEELIGQLKHVHVFDAGLRHHLVQSRLHRLGGAEVSGAHGGGQYQDAGRFGPAVFVRRLGAGFLRQRGDGSHGEGSSTNLGAGPGRTGGYFRIRFFSAPASL